MAKKSEEKFKQLLSDLFSETTSLESRINNYLTKVELLFNEIKEKSSDVSFQDERAISLLLTLRNPSKYTFFKDSFYKKLCEKLQIKSKKKGQKYVHYLELVNIISQDLIRNDSSFIEYYKGLLNEDCIQDENLLLLTQDFLYEVFDTERLQENSDELKDVESRKIWLISTGSGSKTWMDFQQKGFISIGWDYLGDLSQYKSRDEITELVNQHTGRNSYNDSLACWEFLRVMKPGDIVIPKSGSKKYLGYGIISSDYLYNHHEEFYKNVRNVNWVKTGEWIEKNSIVGKTLTDISKYPEYTRQLSKLLGFDDINSVESNNEVYTVNSQTTYWWLNANPKYWSLSEHPLGSLQTYTTHTANGTKRRIYKHFQSLKPGDLIIGYETTPVKKVTARLIVTRGLFTDEDNQESIEFKVDSFYTHKPSWDELVNDPKLSGSEVLTNNQGSLFQLTEDHFKYIESLASGTYKAKEKYSITDALRDTFIDEKWLNETLSIWKTKLNLVLQGPPGTGKTFIAERLALLLMGEIDYTRIHLVQFHPSYSYEDFMEGYRPDGNGGFVLRSGHFLDFCRRASSDENRPYVFIIDEINRGNLSKIFGEIMMGIESDKRNRKFKLQYNHRESFSIPKNVFLIGTMNTADRSLALVDYALRRRFLFCDVDPDFGENFESYLATKNVSTQIVKLISTRMKNINEIIRNDSSLGKGFEIGHSYFCAPPGNVDEQIRWYQGIIRYEITPLLSEYWFDQPEQLDKVKNLLVAS